MVWSLCLIFFLYGFSTSDSKNVVDLSQLQKWYVSVCCLMWHILCFYARFTGNGKVMLTDLRDLCDEEEAKSVLSSAG
jgi:hypothetical protein